MPTGPRETLPSAGQKVQITGTRQSGRCWVSGYVACVVTFSRHTLAGGTEKLFYRGLSHCQCPWLLRDGFCQCVHTDKSSQFRIVAIFTVVDSQTLHQRNLPLFRCVSLITAVPNFTYIVSVVHYIEQSKHWCSQCAMLSFYIQQNTPKISWYFSKISYLVTFRSPKQNCR